MSSSNTIMQSVNESTKILVVGYARLSQEEKKQERKTSIANQQEYFRQWAAEKKGELVNIFVDLKTHGWVWERKPFMQAVELCRELKKKNPESEVVLLGKQYSRMFRNLAQQETVVGDLLDEGIRVIAILNPAGEGQDVIRQVEGAMNQHYITTLKGETKKLHQNLLSQGKPIGPPPFGYRIDENKKSSTFRQWLIHPKHAAIVQQVFARRHEPYKKVCEELGINLWKRQRILKNEKVYQGHQVIGFKKRNYRGAITGTEPYVGPGVHQPIIDKNLKALPLNRTAAKSEREPASQPIDADHTPNQQETQPVA